MQKVYLVWTHTISRITGAKAVKPGSLFFVLLAVLVSVSAYISIYAERAQAAANDTVNFQARLLKNTGSVVADGFYTVEFNIYAQASGGTTQWTESQALTAKNGYLTANLGSVTPLSGIDWSQEQWLSMNVNGDGEMSPRMKITAVPLAFRAVQADNLTTSTGTVTGDDLAQVAPTAAQTKNSTNSLLRLNQTGSGGLLQLQANGIDILTVSNAGDLSTTRGVTVGSSTSTTAGTIRWSGIDFEGYDGSQWVSLTAGTGGGGSGGLVNQKTVIKSVDESLTNNATLQNDDELSFTVGANEEWAFRFVLQANSATQPDFQFAVGAPGGATCSVGVVDGEGAVTNGNLGCGVSSGSIAGNGANDVYEVVGTVRNGPTAGAVTLQWAQNASNANTTTVYAGSYLLATSTTGSSGSDFAQGGNSFTANAVLGTNDNYALNFITNGTLRMSLSNTGVLSILNGASVANGLSVSSGGATITGNSVINGTLSGLTGLTVNSGGLLVSAGGADITGNTSIDGVLNLNGNGITNTGDITGVGSNITADGGLTISSGAGNNLSLSAGSGTIVLGANTLQANNAGTTTLDLNDSANTLLSLINSDGTAVADLSVEGQTSAQSFSGDGSSLTNLNASNLATGTVSDSLLSTNVAKLDTAQTFTSLQTLSSGLVLGNTASTSAGTLRWTGADFEGYDGSQWVSLTGGGGGSVITDLSTFYAYDAAGNINLTAGWTDITLDTQVRADSAYSHTAGNAPVTIQEDGWYEITYDIGTYISTGANRTSSQAKLQENTGGGFTDVPGSLSYMYNRNNANGYDSASATVTRQFTAGDIIKLQAQAFNGTDTVLTQANSVRVNVKKISSGGGGGGASNAFVQGGNDFGATALLGTTAANDLALVTSGTARLTINAAGDVAINNNLTVSGNLTADLDTLLNGNITLGNDAGDALTINSSAVTISNGLIFDSGTFTIDSTNDFIGINNNAPGNRLSINTPAAADATAEVLVYTGGAANKALVLQAVSGQTANILEAQDNNGASLFAVSANGSLILGNDTASPTAGQLVLNDSSASNGFTGVLGISSLTNNRSINLPDASGTVCLSGNLGCGFIVLAPGAAQTDTTTNNSLFVNKTGASGNIILLQKNGTDVFTVGNDGALALRLNSASALSVLNGSGIPVLTVDTTNGAVRIGNTTADATGTLLVLDTKTTAGDPTGVNGGTYYNSNANKFRCFENNTWRDCIYEPYVRSFVDTTVDATVDSNTTNYWDTSAENNNSYPNITPTSTSKSIMAIVTLETTATGPQDTEITARVERGIGSVPTCGSGTSVGGQPGVFSTNTGAIKTSTTTIIDNPNTTNTVYYVVCSDVATNGTNANITRLRVTLQEVNNQN